MNTALETIVSNELEALGFDLVELRIGGTRKRPVVDIRVDRRDGAKVSIDDCVLASRAIEPAVEASGLLAENYVLEVSSPGMERPLKRAADWQRFAGRNVSVLSEEVGGRNEFEIVGLEGESGAEVAVLKDKQGAEVRVPLAAVKEARLVFHWQR